MKIGKWSNTAGANNATPPDGWPEGQAPSTVNDCAREMMAQIRTMANNVEFIDLGNSPTYVSAVSFNLNAPNANFHVGRRLKLFDSTTLYGTINSASGTYVQVRLDAGALSNSLSSVALGAPVLNHALPDAVYAQQNVLINGDFDIWQRGTFFGDAQNFQYTADRWMFEKSGTLAAHGSVLQKPQSASVDQVPTVFQCGRYINNALQYVVTATQAVLANADYAMLTQVVEGFNFRPIAFSPMSLSFWVNTNRSGVYSVALRDMAADFSYVTAFTVTAVNTYSRFFLTLPPTDNNPGWNFDTQAGLRVSFVLACGTDNMVSNAGSWTAANLIAVQSQANLLDTAFNYFTVAAIELKKGWGDVPCVQRQYGDELRLCQRYYWRGLPGVAMNMQSFAVGSIISWPIMFPATMRTTPSLSTSLSNTTFSGVDPNQTSWDAATPQGARFLTVTTSIGINSFVTFGSGDFLAADAEL